MGKVYIGQTRLKIVVDTKNDISNASVKLKYKTPNNLTGDFNMNVTDAINGIAEYEAVLSTDFNVPGDWIFWAYVTYDDGDVAPGEPFHLKFYKEGK
jgi:uncharacterized SAM-dependent methyltransferase